MARSLFAGRPGDAVVSLFDLGNRQLIALPTDANGDTAAVVLTVWDEPGGTQLTDLRAADGTTPITQVVVPVGARGQIPEFYGPDGVNVAVYIRDPDGDYFRLDARLDVAAEQVALDADRAEEAAASVQRDEPGGVAPLDGDTRVPQVNLPEHLAPAALSASIAATAVLDQVDLADLAATHAPRYTDCQLARLSSTLTGVRLHDGERGAIYRFSKDANDDFIKLDACYTGYGYSQIDLFDPTTGALTGTWNTATSSWYTTASGATFTGTVTGDRIDLRLIKESRGGMWSVTIDGASHGTISCWNATTTAAQLVTLATGLDPETEHTVVLTYAGDDPAHVPSSGAGTGRAYVRDDAAGTLVGYVPGAATTKMVLADGSNKEFAWSVAGAGTVGWFPEHNTVGTCFKVTDPVWLVDGVETDLSAMADGETTPATEQVELRQHFKGRLNSTDLIEFWTTHRVTADGRLTFEGRAVALTAVDAVTGYCLMLPASQTFADRHITALGTIHTNLAQDYLPDGVTPNYTYLTADRDNSFSGAVVSATNTEIIGAATLRNPRLTYRRGKTARPPVGEELFVWNRATKPKLYWQPFDETPMAAGDAYVWGFNLVVADVPGIYKALTAS